MRRQKRFEDCRETKEKKVKERDEEHVCGAYGDAFGIKHASPEQITRKRRARALDTLLRRGK